MKVTILNTSILTAHGSFSYAPCSLEQAKQLIADGYQSAVGHESTAEIISTLLGVEVKMNRIQYQQQAGDTALVFKLKGRAPEGQILTAMEVEEIGYEWGVLERTDRPSRKPMIQPLSSWERAKRFLEEKSWWTMDHIIMPIVCFFLVIGFVAAVSSGLERLFSCPM